MGELPQSSPQSGSLADGAAEIRRAIAIVWSYRQWIALFVLSAMLSSLAYTYIYSEKYAAVKTIMFRPNSAVGFELEERQPTALGFPVPLLPFEVIGETIEQVGTSERILRPVVAALNLDAPAVNMKTGWAWYYEEAKTSIKQFMGDTWSVLKHGRVIHENPTSSAIKGLAAAISIDSTRKNYTAMLTVLDKDPQRAAIICDKVADELVQFMKDLSVQAARRQAEKLTDRLNQKKLEVDSLRAEIEALKTSRGFTSLTDETNLVLQTQERVRQKLADNIADLTSALAEQKSVADQLKLVEPMLKSSETTDEDPIYDRLRTLRTEQDVELSGLLKRVPEGDQQVSSLRAQIATAQAMLDATQAKRIESTTTGVNRVHQELTTQLVNLTGKVEGLRASQKSLMDSLAEATARLLPPEVESKLNNLNLRLQVIETDYRKLSILAEAANSAAITSEAEVYTLHPATPQELPKRPIKIYHVALSGVLASILGISFCFFLDFMKPARSNGSPARAGPTDAK